MDCSLPGSSVHRFLQGRILEWVAIPTSRDFPDSGIKPESLISPAGELATLINSSFHEWFLCSMQCTLIAFYPASLVSQLIKNLPALQKTCVQSLGQEDPLEKEMAMHSSILAWEISWTEGPARLQSMGSQRVRHVLTTKQQQEYKMVQPLWKTVWRFF